MNRLTKDLIVTAIQELEESGAEATVITLQKHLGRGSYSTITKYLNEYKQADQSTEIVVVEPVSEVVVPSELLKQAVELAETQVATIYTSVEKTFLSAKLKIQSECDDRVQESEVALQAHMDEHSKLLEFSDQQSDALEKSQEHHADVAKKLLEQLGETSELENNIKVMSALEIELRNQISDLKEELKKTQYTAHNADLTAQKTISELRADIATQSEIDKAQKLHLQARDKSIIELTEKKQALEKDLSTSQIKLGEQKDDLDKAKRALADTKNNISDLAEEHRQAKGHILMQQEKIQALTKENKELKKKK